MTSAASAHNLRCRLDGRDVLVDVALEVNFGEVLALVGPNGAGKSTLLAALCGDRAVSDGTVCFSGRPLAEWTLKELARERSVLLQTNHVSFPFTVREVVEMGRSPWRGVESEHEAEAAIRDAMVQADVVHLAERRFTALSGGERSRVSLARVLAQQAPVVVLDEPTAALDLRHQEDVMEICRSLAQAGRAVVVVLHDLSLAAAWADRMAIFDDGRLVALGAPSEVLTVELIRQVYGVEVTLWTPMGGPPVVLPRRRGFPAPSDGAGPEFSTKHIPK